jgi:hypothetical protein
MAKKRNSGFSGLLNKMNQFLDTHILPWPVRYLTFRLVILVTMGLLIPLIIFANQTVMVLMINSYLNVMSVAVSSIVLLYSTISEAHQKQIARMQEERARQDHQHVTDMHTLILQSVENQRAEIAELRRLLSQMTGEPVEELEKKSVQDLQALHPAGTGRFHAEEMAIRMKHAVHGNALVSSLDRDFPSGDYE